MAIRGNRIPLFGKPPITAGGEDRFVKLFPVREEVSNGRMGLLNEWISRPGYESVCQLDSTADVVGMAHHRGVVSVASDGKVFRSTGANLKNTYELEGRLGGPHRPSMAVHDDALIIADGGDPVVVEDGRLRKCGVPAQNPGVAVAQEMNYGGILPGRYAWYVSITTIAGESTIGQASNVIEFTGNGPHGARVFRPEFDEDSRPFILSWSLWRGLEGGDAIGFVSLAGPDDAYIEDNLRDALGSTPEANSSGSYPPRFTDVCVVGDYLVYSGHDSIEIGWFNPGSHDYVPPGFTTAVRLDGGHIQTIRGVSKDLMVFRTNSLDLYALVANEDIFRLRVSVPRGCMAKHSVVMVDNSVPHWLGDDGSFYRLNGATAEPIGLLEQDLVWSLREPEDLVGMDFPREKVVRWFFQRAGVCIGYNYAKGHFFQDWSWDGKKIPLDVHSTVHVDGTVYVGLGAGRVATWGREFFTDDGKRIRAIQRFTVPLVEDGRQARVNAIVLRHQRGTHDPAEPDSTVAWDPFKDQYRLGDRVYGARGRAVVYVCIRDNVPSGLITDAPGASAGRWESDWRIWTEAADDRSLVVSWGFDQGSECGKQRISSGDLGDTAPFTVMGPLGFGREMWVEVEHPAAASFALTGGFLIARPLGDRT